MMRLVFLALACGMMNVEAWLCTAGTPCMCHHPAAGSAVYAMGCLMSPCPSMSPINDMPAGSLFVHHPQVNGCDGMIPGVFYNPGYGGGACIPISSLDNGYPCCETTSGGFSTTNDPNCARDTVTSVRDAPIRHNRTTKVQPPLRHFDSPNIHPQPRATSPHQGHLNSNQTHHHDHHNKDKKHHKGGDKQHHKKHHKGDDEPIIVDAVKPEAGHAYYIQNAPLCTMRFPPGDPHYTIIMCTAQCGEQFVFSGPSPDGNLAVGTIGGSALCHGKAAVPWSCIMASPDC